MCQLSQPWGKQAGHSASVAQASSGETASHTGERALSYATHRKANVVRSES